MTERGCYGRCDAFDALHRVIYILLHVLKYYKGHIVALPILLGLINKGFYIPMLL